LSGTRVSASNGLIFKLTKTITVPAKPGKITVTVVAEQTGSMYNIAPTSFKLVGFKGTAKYDGFSVSSASTFSGGASGLTSVIKEEDRAKALAGAQADLKNTIVSKARLQIPSGYVIFDDGMIISYLDQINSQTGTAASTTITIKASLSAILFNSDKLGEYLAGQKYPDEQATGVRVANLSSLTFQFLNKDKFDSDKTNSISFSLGGDAKLIWPVNISEIRAKLVGTSLGDRDKVFSNYPSISRAEAAIYPPWIRSFPDDAKKVNIVLITK
jgi:hypothetical protein